MPRAHWPLRNSRPCIEVLLTMAAGGAPTRRLLLADTGAGSKRAAFELILDEEDCLLCDGNPDQPVTLGGAYAGSFPTYILPVQIPVLGFQDVLRVVGVPTPPAGFDGIACFRFLNRFHFGNFGDQDAFGLEV